ncbi:MAG: ATP-dependent DNA helicase RecG [Candidatus Portnoybacteria bacterium]|nr:ATP-dependent DNA helicase RecG [Candidatus Portnoybacteria bacterium]
MTGKELKIEFRLLMDAPLMDIKSPIQSFRRVSPAYQKRLLKLGIKTFEDLFYYFPYRYDDFSKIIPIANLKINETATIQGEITRIKNIRTWKKRMFVTEAFIQDENGAVRAVWFNQPFLMNSLKEGQWISLSGKVNFDKTLYFSNPAHEKIVANATSHLRHTGRLVPVYPETRGLSSRWLRYIIQLLLPKFLPEFKDHLPFEIKKSQNLIDLKNAIKEIHFPQSANHLRAARRRLAFDELFLIQLFAQRQKIKWKKQYSQKINFDQKLAKDFVDSLPFKLTEAQRRSAWEILQDLEKDQPMNRLLEGDVGSGKTVVAAMAILQAVKAGWQAAFMAPTEILAQQHFKVISKLFQGQQIIIGLLTGSETSINSSSEIKSQKKKELLDKISSGQIHLLIGTHALIQENINFKNLALAIVDEQHRFGVAQRAALQKNILKIKDGQPVSIPHLLSMTATPIPRTLALAACGDLDISLLDEMPKDRQEIVTKIIPPLARQNAYTFIKDQVKKGRQVFVICPRIEIANNHESGTNNTNKETNIREIRDKFVKISDKRSWDDVKTVKEEFEKLDKIIFPDLKIAMLHGKMKPKEKEKIMADFKAGKTDILVSTSVIEVGIDIPNASVMMIEGAERFGLAQLHQFRGRVGRGSHQSYCFLFTTGDKAAGSRLRALTSSKNGFELAEKDLEIRGPGEFFGTRQWGLPDLSMASLTDIVLVKAVREEAEKLVKSDPELKNYPLLTQKIFQKQTLLHLE